MKKICVGGTEIEKVSIYAAQASTVLDWPMPMPVPVPVPVPNDG